MILASHIIISGLLGSQTDNYFLAAAIGFLSHYVLDGIPHWDYLSDEFEAKAQNNLGFIKSKKFWGEISKVFIDIAAGFGLLLILIISIKEDNIIPAIIGAIFGILPDPLGLFYWMTKLKTLKWNSDIQYFVHHSIHKKIKQKFLPGILVQAATIIAIWLIIYFW